MSRGNFPPFEMPSGSLSFLREGVKKIDFFLGKSPKLWVGGGCHLPTQFWEAVSKKHAKISSRILKQVPLNNVALLLCPNQTLVAVDAIFKKSTLFQSESY